MLMILNLFKFFIFATAHFERAKDRINSVDSFK